MRNFWPISTFMAIVETGFGIPNPQENMVITPFKINKFNTTHRGRDKQKSKLIATSFFQFNFIPVSWIILCS